MVLKFSFLVIFLSPISLLCQNVNIPDSIFKDYLINNLAINTNQDIEIQLSEANTFSGAINIYDKRVSSLEGIEHFTNLRLLNCSRNNLDVIDVSNNILLQSLYCNRNNLQSLDISSLGLLNYLQCNHNSLSVLDISNNLNLKGLFCSDNNITSLELGNSNFLNTVFCFNNPLTIFNSNSAGSLSSLKINNTQLTSLNLSTNNHLIDLDCSNCNLLNLDISNGETNKIKFFDSRGNEDLNCIEVDQVNWANSNLNLKDSFAIFSTNCF